MFGRATASQIASASLPSFLPLAIGRYELRCHQPRIVAEFLNCRVHSCAPEQASSPMTQQGSCAMSANSLLRLTILHSTTLPRASTPGTENTFFAKSIPVVHETSPSLMRLKVHTHDRPGKQR
jgi:hypothetical protein